MQEKKKLSHKSSFVEFHIKMLEFLPIFHFFFCIADTLVYISIFNQFEINIWKEALLKKLQL